MGNSLLKELNGPPEQQLMQCIEMINNFADQQQAKMKTKDCLAILKKISEIASPQYVQISAGTANALGTALEKLRKLKPSNYEKLASPSYAGTGCPSALDAARLTVCSRVLVMVQTPGQISQQLVAEAWSPRVVRSNAYFVGGSGELGLSSTSASANGFCVEAWINVNSITQTYEIMSSTEGVMKYHYLFYFGIEKGKLIAKYGRSTCMTPKAVIVPFHWVHVACYYANGSLFLARDGISLVATQAKFVKGEFQCVVGYGSHMNICEMRIWNVARSGPDIQRTLGVSIPPSSADQFPGLRFCWFPLALGGTVYPSGSLLYDVWSRQSVGRRSAESAVPDSRWPCALPSALRPVTDAPWTNDFEFEISE